jgi:hypothetical protein
VPTISGEGQVFLLAQQTLTHAQILALPTTPFELIPAPRAGQIIVPLHGLAVFNWTANYTNIDPNCRLSIVQENSAFASDFVASITEAAIDSAVSILLANGESAITVFPTAANVNQGVDARDTLGHVAFETPGLIDGRNIVLAVNNQAAGNFTGGNVANKMLVAVTYYVLTLPA